MTSAHTWGEQDRSDRPVHRLHPMVILLSMITVREVIRVLENDGWH